MTNSTFVVDQKDMFSNVAHAQEKEYIMSAFDASNSSTEFAMLHRQCCYTGSTKGTSIFFPTNVGECETRGVQLAAISNLTNIGHLILNTSS